MSAQLPSSIDICKQMLARFQRIEVRIKAIPIAGIDQAAVGGCVILTPEQIVSGEPESLDGAVRVLARDFLEQLYWRLHQVGAYGSPDVAQSHASEAREANLRG